MIEALTYEFSYKTVILILLMIVLLGVTIYLIYAGYKFLRENSILSDKAYEVYNKINTKSTERKQKESLKKLYSARSSNDKSLLIRLDRLIVYSGINKKFKWISSEIVIIAMILLGIISMIGVTILTHGIIYGLGAMILVEYVIYLWMVIARDLQYIKVEDSLNDFIGVIQNYSMLSNDIITIFEKALPDIDEPIKTYVKRCVLEAKSSGKRLAAMKRLEDSIENSYFKMIIRNLAICSSYSANYAKVIDQCKATTEIYISHERENRQINKNNAREMAKILTVGIMSVYASTFFIDENISMLRVIKSYGNIGTVIVILALFVIMYTIYITIIKPLKH